MAALPSSGLLRDFPKAPDTCGLAAALGPSPGVFCVDGDGGKQKLKSF